MHTKSLLAGSALAILFAASAQAAVTGSIDASLTYYAEAHGMKSHGFIGGLTGQANFGVTQDWNGQIEIFADGSDANRSSWFGKYSDQLGMATYGATAHLNTQMDDLRVGGFLMLEDTTVGDRGYHSDGAGGNVYLAVGGEGQWFFTPDLDVVGQLGGLFNIETPGTNSDTCNALCNAFFFNVAPTWFFSDNLMVSANFGMVTGEHAHWAGGFNHGMIGYDYGARVEYQFDNSPFSAYLAWDGNQDHVFSGLTQGDNTISLGVKLYFDGETMRHQHEVGAFKTPHFERVINQSISVDDITY